MYVNQWSGLIHVHFIQHTCLMHLYIFLWIFVVISFLFYSFATGNELNMNLKILSLVIIGVCILLPDVCYAFLSKDVHLLNMQNGLADNTVSAVYKDKEGFIWFGTRNGLSRYDGRRITNFERSRSYPSISNLKEVFDRLSFMPILVR